MKDYGRKQYYGMRYAEWMRTSTSKAVWNNIIESFPEFSEFKPSRIRTAQARAYEQYMRQSMLKKPWRSTDSFPVFEHRWDGPPGVPLDPGKPRKPDQPWNLQIPGGPLSQVCDLDSSGGFCPGETRTVSWTASRPVLFFTVTYKSDPTTIVTASGGGLSGTWDIAAGSDEGLITIQATMESAIQGQSCSSNVNITEGSDCVVCPPSNPLACDYTLTPATMGRSSSVTVTFSNSNPGGTGPYNWAVFGTGFSNGGSATTTTLSNTLSTDGTACGTGGFTITDACGFTATCEVRCTAASSWVRLDPSSSRFCPWGSPLPPDISANPIYTKFQGRWQIRIRREGATGSRTCSSTPPANLDLCTPAQIAGCQAQADSGAGLCNNFQTAECIDFPLFGIYTDGDWPCIQGKTGGCAWYTVRRCLCNGSFTQWEWKCN